MKVNNLVVKEYLFLMIGRKEITGSGFKNRKPSDFYRLLRLKANFYNCSLLDIIVMEAYFICRGEIFNVSGIERLKQIAY